MLCVVCGKKGNYTGICERAACAFEVAYREFGDAPNNEAPLFYQILSVLNTADTTKRGTDID